MEKKGGTTRAFEQIAIWHLIFIIILGALGFKLFKMKENNTDLHYRVRQLEIWKEGL